MRHWLARCVALDLGDGVLSSLSLIRLAAIAQGKSHRRMVYRGIQRYRCCVVVWNGCAVDEPF